MPLTCDVLGNPFFLCAGFQRCSSLFDNVQQVHALAPPAGIPFIQLGQAQDIFHQGQHALAFAQDLFKEILLILGLDQAAGQQLGIPADGGQRRAQLVRNIGSKALACRFRLIFLGHIAHQHHAAALPADVVGGNQITAAIQLHRGRSRAR